VTIFFIALAIVNVTFSFLQLAHEKFSPFLPSPSSSLQSSMQFMAGFMKEGLGGTKLLHATRLPTTDPIAISKIYPTPPSVETSDKRYEEPELMEESGPVSIWEEEGLVEDEMNLVPQEFAPLPLSPRPKLPLHCIYVKKEVSMLCVCESLVQTVLSLSFSTSLTN
jgi:hypothetical protein